MNERYTRGEDPRKYWDFDQVQTEAALEEAESNRADMTSRAYRRRIHFLTTHQQWLKEYGNRGFLGTRKDMGQYRRPVRPWNR